MEKEDERAKKEEPGENCRKRSFEFVFLAKCY
jgi:hypothetical protein